ncbi:MAG TPA: 2OG-Fe(II) oxygenase family protein [Woeseiaceae bacterium]|nr:2OG-Fe(II) oxygenase family protein [Woeseiaceae bacterium]
MARRHRWIADSDVLSLFPTLVWQFALTHEIRGDVNRNIMKALDGLRPVPAMMKPGCGWQSGQALHELEAFQGLVSLIQDAVGSILEFLRVGYDKFEITGCWANISPPGASHKAHHHPNNFLSGVYYVQTGPGADSINFHDPRVQTGMIRPPVTGLTAANTDQVVVRVRDGALLLFPAWLEHSVDGNESGRERISVSFNVMFSSFTENLSRPLW